MAKVTLVETKTTEVAELNLDLEFFRVVLGWNNIVNLPSFSVAMGSEQGWAMINRELQKCHVIKEAFVGDKYLVAVQKEKSGGIAIGEGRTLAQAATLALTFAYQKAYPDREKMQEFKQALSSKHKEQLLIPAFKRFHCWQNSYIEGEKR